MSQIDEEEYQGVNMASMKLSDVSEDGESAVFADQKVKLPILCCGTIKRTPVVSTEKAPKKRRFQNLFQKIEISERRLTSLDHYPDFERHRYRQKWNQHLSVVRQ